MGNFSNYWDLHTLFTKIKNKIKSVSDKIDASVSLKTATGNPITLTDAANANAEELLMTIEPVQSGSGDPSPTNVRPISGISEATVTRTGKNLIDESALIAAKLDPTTGQPSASTDVKITPMISIKSSATYLFAHQNGEFFRIFAYAADGTFIERSDIYSGDAVVTTGATWAYVRIQSANSAWSYTDPVLTQTADIAITLGQTVYGGIVNFKTGEVTVTHGMVDLGTLDWHKENTSSNHWRFWASLVDFKKVGVGEFAGFICSNYREVSANQTWQGIKGVSGNGLTSNSICVCDETYSDVAELTTAMSGVQLCYELATPTTLTLTPAELELLKGNNTITANGAEINIEYYPDNAIGVLAGRVDTASEQIDDVSSGIFGIERKRLNASNEDNFLIQALTDIKMDSINHNFSSINRIYTWIGIDNYVFLGFRMSITWLYAFVYSYDRAYIIEFNCNTNVIAVKKTVTLT